MNQTLYFLRRDIDPWYDDDVSVDYVRYESELLWLDQRLVVVDSVRFYNGAARRPPKDVRNEDLAVSLLNVYTGTFCPEFEYEEWALGWRDRLHSVYLALMQQTQVTLIRAGRLQQALQLALLALQTDPDAGDTERTLVWLYSAMGARAAAAEQYEHYAATQRDQLGIEPPSLSQIAAMTPEQVTTLG